MMVPPKSKFAGHKIVANLSGMFLARTLSEELGAELVSPEDCGFFPDQTTSIQVPKSLHNKHVILVGGIRSNDELVQVGLLQSALRGVCVESITTVVPYFFYGRQDRGRNGEPLGAMWMARAIGNTDRIIVVDPHNDRIAGFDSQVFSYGPTCTRELGEWLQDKQIDLVLAPDEGALPRAKALGEFLGVPFDNYEKKRLTGSEVSVKPKKLDRPFGSRIAIVDDIISTAGTMIAAAKAAREDGVSYVIAICTHGLFVGDALKRLRSVCDEVASTTTVRSEAAKISCVPAIVRALEASIQQ